MAVLLPELLFVVAVFLELVDFLLVVPFRLLKGFLLGAGRFCSAEVGMSREALSSWLKLASRFSIKDW